MDSLNLIHIWVLSWGLFFWVVFFSVKRDSQITAAPESLQQWGRENNNNKKKKKKPEERSVLQTLFHPKLEWMERRLQTWASGEVIGAFMWTHDFQPWDEKEEENRVGGGGGGEEEEEEGPLKKFCEQSNMTSPKVVSIKFGKRRISGVIAYYNSSHIADRIRIFQHN